MGNVDSVPTVSFEDVQIFLKNPSDYILLNTIDLSCQECLILNTLRANYEEERMNYYLTNNNKIPIVIYGRNSSDKTIYQKYKQLQKLGFKNVYIYPGGLFEWLLLQDIYGTENFPTTKKELDILKYKSKCKFYGLLQ